MDLPIRFLVNGLVVSFFAVIGDATKPKNFVFSYRRYRSKNKKMESSGITSFRL